MLLKRKIKLLALLAFIGPLKYYSCSSDNIEEFYNEVNDPDKCTTDNVTFNSTIYPIIDRNCLGCHYAGNATGVELATYDDVKNEVESGKLMGAIKHEDGYRAMPLSANKLDSCTIAKFEKWVNDGAPNN